jgi:hypothetical protein
MSADFRVLPQHRLVFSYGTGVFTRGDFLDHMARLSRDPQFKPDFDQIVDCRSLTFMLSTEEIRDLAGRSVFSAQSRRAFIASSDLQFGLNRMFATYNEMTLQQKVMVFRHLPEALSWLGLPRELEIQLDPPAKG